MDSAREMLDQAGQTPVGRKAKRVWPDAFNLAIGGWLVLSAFVPTFSGPRPGQLASGLTGLLIAAISVAAMLRVEHWKEATNLVLGLWLIAAPFVLGIWTLNPILNFTLDGGFLVLHSAFQILKPPWRRHGAF